MALSSNCSMAVTSFNIVTDVTRGATVAEMQAFQTDRSTGMSKPKRYAVVVGVNDYTEAGIGNLSCCAADAEAFYDALLTYCEYDPANIILFSDGRHKDARQPTRSDILAAITDMAARAM